MTTKPDRWAYFPPVQIFGRNIVPIYQTEDGPAVPLEETVRATGIPANTIIRILSGHRELVSLCRPGETVAIPPEAPLSRFGTQLCLGMDAIALVILSVDPARLEDPVTRRRIIVAKKWLLLQLANRLKTPGRKNQPRWDSGLNKKQMHDLKKLFDALPAQAQT